MATRVDPDGTTLRDLRDRAQEAHSSCHSNRWDAWRAFQKLIEELDPEFLVALCDDYGRACEKIEEQEEEIEKLQQELEAATATEEG